MRTRNPETKNHMDEKQAKTLGNLLKQRRQALGLSMRQLAKLVDVRDVTILRFELGDQAAPAPDKLARIAQVLGLSLADVYALADYAVPTDLPSFTPYLRTKYRELPADEIEKIQTYAANLARRHGVDLSGPALGEDEA